MFDNRLKELRIKKGLNMKQLAEALNIPYTTYVGYEKNEREPNSEIIVAIADFFDVSTDYLLGRVQRFEVCDGDKAKNILGAKMKERRTQLKITQLELSELTDIKKNTISNYENGISFPSEENILKIINALKCDANFLFGCSIENSRLIPTLNEKTFIDKYSELDDYGKEAVDDILNIEYRRCTDVQYAFRIARSFNDSSKPKVVKVDESKFINAPENDIDM